MIFLSNVIGLAGHALFWGAALAVMLRKHPYIATWLAQVAWRIWLLPLLVLACGWAWYARGIFSDISITGMVLSYCWLSRREVKLPLCLLAGWVGLGVVLYASALGFIAPDFYSFGFGPQLLLVVVLVWAVINGIVNPLLGWMVAAVLAAYAGRLLTSVNLWDYLIDPLTWIVLASMALRSVLHCLRIRYKKQN